jgi:hypothetical protein
MDSLGLNLGFLLVQILSLLVVFGWIAFVIVSLFNLRTKKLTGTPLVMWVLIICAIPVLGALAYWIVKPSAESQ